MIPIRVFVRVLIEKSFYDFTMLPSPLPKILLIMLSASPSVASAACYLNNTSSDVTRVLIDTDKSALTNAAKANRDITTCDVSGMTSMSELFRDAYSFNQDITGWDVSNVTTMFRIFNQARAFNQDISGWDVSSVTNMVKAFKNAWSFNQDLSTWNVLQIAAKPREFDNLATNWTEDRPIWGTNAGVGVPTAPSGLSATAGESQVSVTFTAPADDGGAAITDYEYQLDTGNWVSGSTTSSPIVITGLSNGTTYSIKLRAVNAAGNGEASTAVSSAPIDMTAPSMTIISAEVSDGATSDDATLSLTFNSSEATSNFVSDDITVTNGVVTSFAAVSSTVYTAILTPTAAGAVTIAVALGAFTDAAGNQNAAATQFTWTYAPPPEPPQPVYTLPASLLGLLALLMPGLAVASTLTSPWRRPGLRKRR